jgi:hypothetical protein
LLDLDIFDAEHGRALRLTGTPQAIADDAQRHRARQHTCRINTRRISSARY